ncbi:TolC family protein [Aquabacterium sp.]|uniref:TolC family protein n=1 Tax=Aquabacterium sp. TaxID=1872578 RepID=UPI002488F32D|nr:TolC family protein [Aquabacterium sp.]MDI1349896.1 TolC family protein [Aquabacterium sp.]
MKQGLNRDLGETADRLTGLTRTLALAALLAAAATLLLLVFMPAQAHAAEAQAEQARPDEATALPADAAVTEALQRSPAWRVALQRHQAERARGAAVVANPNDWTPSASWAQRNARADVGAASPAGGDVRTREWSLGLSRGLRLPAKAEAASAAGQGQQARADAQLAMAWRELVRTWLDDAVGVLQASRQEQLLAAQLRLWEQQHQAATRRHALGDAARQELVLLDAGRAQAQAQWLQAQQRWQAAQGVWRSRYPGLPLPQTGAPSDAMPSLQGVPASAPEAAEAAEAAWLDAHPQWRLARLEAEAAEAQARLAEAERQPDPTVGVQLGRERSGAERILGVNVSWPLGSAARSLQSQAQWADAQAARAQEGEVRRELQRNLTQWRAEWRAGQQVWQAAEQAQAQTRQAAQAVRKGYELGEGSLSEVLLLQRQWLEQQQAAATAELEALRARWRWELETGTRWAWAPEAAR